MRVYVALFAGFAGALVLFLSAGYQATAAKPIWPPHPRDVVQLYGHSTGDSILDPGEEIVIYTVRTDKWFVITYFMGGSANHFGTGIRAYLRGVEHAAGPEEDRCSLLAKSFSTGNRFGLVFAPGTEVKLGSDPTNNVTVSVGGIIIDGYLTLDEPDFSILSLSSTVLPWPGVVPFGTTVLTTTPNRWIFVAFCEHVVGNEPQGPFVSYFRWRKGPLGGPIQRGLIPHNWDTVGTPIPPGSDIIIDGPGGTYIDDWVFLAVER